MVSVLLVELQCLFDVDGIVVEIGVLMFDFIDDDIGFVFEYEVEWWQVDIIVVGLYGKYGLVCFLLGSVVECMVCLLYCIVIVVCVLYFQNVVG